MKDDPFAQDPLLTACTLFYNDKKVMLKALVDTGATGYSFIDETTAYRICEELDLTPIPLSKPKPIKGFDGHLAAKPITHAIYPGIIIQNHSELTAPMLITPLGQHAMVLGKPWLNRHEVILDMRHNSLIFEPGRCAHFGAPPKNLAIPMFKEPSTCSVNSEPTDKLGGLDCPVPPKQYKILQRLDAPVTKEVETITKPINSTATAKPKEFNIAMVGAAPFRTIAHQKGTELFSITMCELDTCLCNVQGQDSIQISEMTPDEQKDMKTKVPIEFHDFLDVFDRKAAEILPPNRTYDHRIELESEGPLPKSRLYAMSQYKLEKTKEYLEENLKKGFITPSSAPYASPILFAQKANGDLRFCVDYRKLNALTKKDRYPLPLIDETLARMAGCKYITKFDIIAAFNKLRMDPASEDLTTFITAMGSYKYRVLPFGLTNGPASYQHYMNDVLLPFLNDFVQAYLDDIIIYSRTRKEHTKHVRMVLEKLREAGLQVDIRKSEFYVQETMFLGLLVSTEGLQMDPRKVQVIVDWNTPTNLTEVQSFVGFCNFYRRFIKGFSKLVRPLTRLAQKDVPFEWTTACQEAFELLKKRVTEAPVLRHFDRARESYLETDSSDYVNGGVLSQKDDEGVLHPVAFYSKNMVPAECNYEIYDKELLAIIRCFEHWRPELEFSDVPVKVFTDHKSLEYFMTTKELTRRQVRWAEKLSEFNFVIISRPGTQNGKADALTRMPGSRPEDQEDIRRKYQQMTLLPPDKFAISCIDTSAPNEPPRHPVNQESKALFTRVMEANIQDEFCTELRIAKQAGQEKCNGISLQNCSIHNEALYFHNNLWVPQNNELLLELVREVHVPPSGGHKGINRTVQLLKRYYHWIGMRKTVDQFIRNCYDCSRSKAPKDSKNGLLNPLPVPEQRWLDISMDFITGLPPTKDGKNAILNVMDRLSKQRHYIACTSDDHGTSTEETLKMLIHWVYRIHGMPASIVSDRGLQFVSTLWKSFCKRMGIEVNVSTAFHPETDGQTERANQDVETFLRTYTNEHQNDWDTWLPMAEFADNNADSAATTLSPFFINHGYHPQMSYGPDKTSYESTRERLQSQNAADISAKMDEILRFTKQHIEQARTQMSKQADRHRKDVDYDVGDMVFLSTKNIKTQRPCKKLDSKMIGPFKITAKVGRALRLELPTTMKIHDVFHPSLLRKAATDPLPGQVPTPSPAVIIDDEEEWEVDDILDSRHFGRGRRLQYRVKWKDWDRDLEWYNANRTEFEHSSDVVNDYHTRNPTKPGPPTGSVLRAPL